MIAPTVPPEHRVPVLLDQRGVHEVVQLDLELDPIHTTTVEAGADPSRTARSGRLVHIG